MDKSRILKLHEMQKAKAELRQYSNDLAYAKKYELPTKDLVKPEFDESAYKELAAEVKSELVAESVDEQTNADRAFKKLIGSFTVEASYPEKQKAMQKAVEGLDSSASASELYNAAVSIITEQGPKE